MSLMTLIIIYLIVLAVICLVVSILDAPSASGRTRDEIRRIGDATIDQMRQTSSDFREYIDRETRSR